MDVTQCLVIWIAVLVVCALQCEAYSNPHGNRNGFRGGKSWVRQQRCKSRCPHELSPVCGTDGTTYINECSLNCKKNRNRGGFFNSVLKSGLEKQCEGWCPCPTPKLCPQSCEAVTDTQEICGQIVGSSDLEENCELFRNQCEYKKEDCELRRDFDLHLVPCNCDILLRPALPIGRKF